MTRILLINDEPIVRAGLRTIFEAHDDLDVVGEEQDGSRVLVALTRYRPDVVILETHVTGASTLRTVRRLADNAPNCAVLLVATENDTRAALNAIVAGARAYLLSSASTSLMVQVVRTIAGGVVVLPRFVGEDLARLLPPELDERRRTLLDALSDREQRVLELLSDGRSNTEIAHDLCVSEATVKKHVSQVLRKLRLRDRLQAGLFGRELGLGHGITVGLGERRHQFR